jgi:hypothetical protein
VYAVDSGGDPRVIPNLTYEQFKSFHNTYYHPSNALIWFYGDDDPDERLRIIDDYARDFEPLDIDREIPLQPRFEQPQRLVFEYDARADENGGAEQNQRRGFVSVNWLLTESIDTETMMALDVLSFILMGTTAAPLRKALIDSDLGEKTIGGGVDNHVRQAHFSAGLKGIDVEKADQVEALILDTLRGLADGGIESDMIEAALNTIEFQVRELNTGSFPRGLALMMGALSTWVYDGDPLAPLQYEEPLARLKAKIEAGGFFEGLIREYLLDNTHRTTVLLRPDPEVAERLEAEEEDRLAKVKESLNELELRQIIEETKALKEAQITPDPPEALATIPGLTLDDIDKDIKTIPIEISDEQGAQIFYHDLFTNGIAYIEVGFDLHQLPRDLLPYLSLFRRSLLQMGTEDEDYVKLTQRIGRKTGGVRTSTFKSAIHGADTSAAYLFLHGKGTPAQTGDLLAIMQDVLLKVKLDNRERFRQLALESKASHESGLIPSGHQVVNRRLRAHFSEADWLSETTSGVTQLLFLRRLLSMIDDDWGAVLEKLEAIRNLLINRSRMIVNVTLDASNWAGLRPQVSNFISAMPTHDHGLHAWTREVYAPQHEGMTIPAQVNYIAKGTNLYNLGFERHGSTAVVTNYLRTTFLWERVRVQGGAYGGFCVFDGRSGVFSYLSYRDPNLLKTLDNYDNAAGFLRDLELDQGEITRSIIGAISSMDDYLLPDAKGFRSMTQHLTGDTDALRQQLRDDVLGATIQDFKRLADVLTQVNEQGLVVVMGSAEGIRAANAERGDFLSITNVL